MTTNSKSYKGKFSSRDYYTLEFIPFVTGTEEQNIVSNAVKVPKKTSSSLSGQEACTFYKDILSIPSTSNVSQRNLVSKVKKNKTTHPQINKYDPRGIFRYAQDGNFDAIKELIKIEDKSLIDEQDVFGWTPLMCAACEGQFDIVTYLLQCGANINIKCKQGQSAKDIAIAKQHYDIINLLECGAEPDPKENDCIVNIKEEKEKYCNDCKLFYSESSFIHERCIAHLFATRKGHQTTFYQIPEDNKGFQLMVKSGWNQNNGLGSRGEGRKFPIKTILKKDRSCIGKNKETARITHFSANDRNAIRRICDPPVKIVREKTLNKRQRAKLEQKNRLKEIEFRRQFIGDY